MNNEPKVLVPYDRREAISLRTAAEIAGRSEVDRPELVPKPLHWPARRRRSVAGLAVRRS